MPCYILWEFSFISSGGDLLDDTGRWKGFGILQLIILYIGRTWNSVGGRCRRHWERFSLIRWPLCGGAILSSSVWTSCLISVWNSGRRQAGDLLESTGHDTWEAFISDPYFPVDHLSVGRLIHSLSPIHTHNWGMPPHLSVTIVMGGWWWFIDISRSMNSLILHSTNFHFIVWFCEAWRPRLCSDGLIPHTGAVWRLILEQEVLHYHGGWGCHYRRGSLWWPHSEASWRR